MTDSPLILEIHYVHQSSQDSSLSLEKRVNERHVQVLIIEVRLESCRTLNLRILMTVLVKTSLFNLTQPMSYHHPILMGTSHLERFRF